MSTLTSDGAPNKTQLRRVNSFDGLRGIAIVLVIMGHAKKTIHIDSFLWDNLSIFVSNSALGVRIFFVLSGYLITYSFIKEIKNTGFLNIRYFFVKRALHILPSFYCFLLVVFLLSWLVGWGITTEQFLFALGFLWNYAVLWYSQGSSEGSWFLGHLWALCVEAQYYLIWPFLFILLRPMHLQILLGFFILLAPFLRVAIYFLIPAQKGYLGIMFHTAVDSILVGCLMAIIFSNPQKDSWIQRLQFRQLLWLMTVPLLLSPILETLINGYGISIGRTFDALCLGVVIVWLHGHPSSWLSDFLEIPILFFVGRISYSLYLWQQLFLTDLNVTVSGIFPVNIAFCFLFGLISYYFVEKPFLSLKKHKAIRNMVGM